MLSSVVLGQQQFTLWPKPREGTKKPECLSVPGLSPPAEPEPEAMRPLTFITTSHCQQEERTQKMVQFIAGSSFFLGSNFSGQFQ